MRKVQKLGWAVAAGLGGFLLAGGFQGSSQKVGVVDVSQVFKDSELTKKKQLDLQTMGNARMEMLRFVHTFRPFTPDQAQRFRALSLKPNASPAEKAELDKIKADVTASDKTLKGLQTKQQPTAADLVTLNELSERAQAMQALEQRWARELDTEMRDQQGKIRVEVLEVINQSVQEIGKKQGYTLIFVREVVPYAANDLTSDALKSVNAKK